MSHLSHFILIAGFLVMVARIWLLLFYDHERSINRQRSSIDDAVLRQASKNSARSGFDPRTATLVRSVEEVRGEYSTSLSVERIYRTPAGEYFLYIGSGGSDGYITHLSVQRAKGALFSSPDIYRREFPDDER